MKKTILIITFFVCCFVGSVFYDLKFTNDGFSLFYKYRIGFLFSYFMFSLIISNFIMVLLFSNENKVVQIFQINAKIKNIVFLLFFIVCSLYLYFDFSVYDQSNGYTFQPSQEQLRESNFKKINEFFVTNNEVNKPGMRSDRKN